MIPSPTTETIAAGTADVFISHAQADRLQAAAICRALEAQGISCWIAPRNIRKGRDYDVEIMRGLKACKALLLLFSAPAADSPHVKREVHHAFDARKPVIPVRIEDLGPGENFEYYLGSVQWFDAFSLPLENYLLSLVELVGETIGDDVTQSPPTPEPVPQTSAPTSSDNIRAVTVPLAWEKDAIYSASLDEIVDWRGVFLFLAVSAGGRTREVEQRAPMIWKLTSRTMLETFIRSAMPGLRMSRPPRLPRAVLEKPGYIYFQIELNGPNGESIQRERNLSVYAPPAFDRLEMELILLIPAR